MIDFARLRVEDYFRIPWRRRWYFLISAFAVTASFTFYAWRLPNVYKAKTTILVESPFIPEEYIRPTVRTTIKDRFNSIKQQVQSRSFIERVVEEFQLLGYETKDGLLTQDAVDTIRKNIEIGDIWNNTFTLSFSYTAPQFAYDMTRRLANALVQSNISSRQIKTIETDQFIDELLLEAQRDLEANEEKIKLFKTTHLGELPEQSSTNLSALSALHSRLNIVENAIQRAQDQKKLLDFRLQEQRRLDLLFSGSSSPSKGMPVPDVKEIVVPRELSEKRAKLAEMSTRYTPKHPDVVRLARAVQQLELQFAKKNMLKTSQNQNAEPLTRLGQTEENLNQGRSDIESAINPVIDMQISEINLEIENVKNEIAKRENEKGSIARQIRLYQNRLNLAPSLEQQLRALNRDHEVLIERYHDLQGKKFNAQMAASLESNKNNETYKIIEEATLPKRPDQVKRTIILLTGLGTGIFLGLLVSFGSEYLDSSLENEEQAASVLNLPVLVVIPEIPKKGKAPRGLIARKSA